MEDVQFSADATEVVTRGLNRFISPFGVRMGKNISGQHRAEKALRKKAFVNSIANLGVTRPIEVQKDDDGYYNVVAGNRRTAVLRHLIGTGVIDKDSPLALLPIYEPSSIKMKTVTSGDAANLIENSMRERISHVAKAIAIDEYMSKGATLAELGLVIVGENNKPLKMEAVRQYRQLLKLHPSVQEAVDDQVLTVMQASSLATMEHAEQIKALQVIKEAQEGSKSKDKSTREALQKMKAKKRLDPDNEPMYDPIRHGTDVRSLFDKLTSVSVWQMVPKAAKLSPKGYKALTAICRDIHTWMLGGLTTKNGKREDVALALKTRILAAVAELEKG